MPTYDKYIIKGMCERLSFGDRGFGDSMVF